MTIVLAAERRLGRPAVIVLVGASGAWAATLAIARHMGVMPGTMGLELAGFLGVWTLMMAAMMLPSVSPLASAYVRNVRQRRARRLVSFGAGYLVVWAAAGVPAFLLAGAAGRLAEHRPAAATAMAVVVFATCGLYQLTPLKDRCLARCRAPLAQLLQYGSWRGRLRDVRVGLHHGAYCLGCCWALMALVVAFGVMNVVAMVVVAAVIAAEKVFVRGATFTRVTGFVALAMAVAVIWAPDLAPGLHDAASVMSHGPGT